MLQEQEAWAERICLFIEAIVEFQLLVYFHDIDHGFTMRIIVLVCCSIVCQIPSLETSVVNVVSDALVAGKVMVVHHHVDASFGFAYICVGVDVARCLVKLVLPIIIFHIFIIGDYRCSVGSTTRC